LSTSAGLEGAVRAVFCFVGFSVFFF
jgi:hypothetical protein